MSTVRESGCLAVYLLHDPTKNISGLEYENKELRCTLTRKLAEIEELRSDIKDLQESNLVVKEGFNAS